MKVPPIVLAMMAEHDGLPPAWRFEARYKDPDKQCWSKRQLAEELDWLATVPGRGPACGQHKIRLTKLGKRRHKKKGRPRG